METTLKQYIRNDKRQKVGVMIATTVGDSIGIGVSKCHEEKDVFDMDRGHSIAEKRIEVLSKNKNTHTMYAFLNPMSTPPIKRDSRGKRLETPEQVNLFMKRCRKYFKVDSIYVWA